MIACGRHCFWCARDVRTSATAMAVWRRRVRAKCLPRLITILYHHSGSPGMAKELQFCCCCCCCCLPFGCQPMPYRPKCTHITGRITVVRNAAACVHVSRNYNCGWILYIYIETDFASFRNNNDSIFSDERCQWRRLNVLIYGCDARITRNVHTAKWNFTAVIVCFSRTKRKIEMGKTNWIRQR